MLAERDALLNGDYEGTLQLAEQARAAFAAVGSEARLAEIRLYESRARELIGLHQQFADAQRLASSGQESEAEIRLATIAARLRSLGDEPTAVAAEALLAGMRARRSAESFWARFAVGGLVALILGHRVASFARRRRRGPWPYATWPGGALRLRRWCWPSGTPC